MSCNGCVRRATEAISSLSGVEKVNIDLVTSKAEVFSKADIDFEEMYIAVKNAGYTLTKSSPSFYTVILRWVKKFKPLLIAFSLVTSFTVARQFIYGWHLHYAMSDFMGAFFLFFGGLKVLNWSNFAKNYSLYDPIASRFTIYAYIYPAIEFSLGIFYVFKIGNYLYLNIITIFILTIATFGIVKVIKSGQMIKCACLGGYFNIPITWVTVFENLLMIFMAVYMQLFLGFI